jgi:HEAT repeat protein
MMIVASIIISVAVIAASDAPSNAELRATLSRYDPRDASWPTTIASVGGKYPTRGGFAQQLVAMLRDEDETVRAGALDALGQLGKDAAIAAPAIEESLQQDESARVRGYAVIALHEILGANSLTLIAPALDDKDPYVRAQALYAVGQESASATAFVQKLRSVLSDTHYYSFSVSAHLDWSLPVRYEAVVALGRIGPKARICLPDLRELLASDPDMEVRIAAAVAMARIDTGDTSGVEYLMKEAERPSLAMLRCQAIQGLEDLNTRAGRSAPLLKRLLREDESESIREACADALPAVNGLGQDTVDALVGALEDPDGEVQLAALQSLEEMASHAASAIPKVKVALDEYMKLPEEDVELLAFFRDIRVQAAATLASIGKRETILPMINQAIDQAKSEDLKSQLRDVLTHDAKPRPRQ